MDFNDLCQSKSYSLYVYSYVTETPKIVILYPRKFCMEKNLNHLEFSLDCENLIRHMLVVDINKRYTINQIKQHKWIIQGEPYQFLLEEDEFLCTQKHTNGENGTQVTYNEFVLEKMKQMVGEEKTLKAKEV